MARYGALPTYDDSDSENEERDVVRGFALCCRNCIFTYVDEDLETSISERSPTDLLTRGIHKIAKLAKPPRLELTSCNFIPPSSAFKKSIDKFIRASIPGAIIKFEGCTFIRRESSLLEKLMDFLYTCIPYGFQIYVSNVGQEAVLKDYTICIKDLPRVLSKVQESALSRAQSEPC